MDRSKIIRIIFSGNSNLPALGIQMDKGTKYFGWLMYKYPQSSKWIELTDIRPAVKHLQEEIQ